MMQLLVIWMACYLAAVKVMHLSLQILWSPILQIIIANINCVCRHKYEWQYFERQLNNLNHFRKLYPKCVSFRFTEKVSSAPLQSVTETRSNNLIWTLWVALPRPNSFSAFLLFPMKSLKPQPEILGTSQWLTGEGSRHAGNLVQCLQIIWGLKTKHV